MSAGKWPHAMKIEQVAGALSRGDKICGWTYCQYHLSIMCNQGRKSWENGHAPGEHMQGGTSRNTCLCNPISIRLIVTQ